MQDAGCKVNGFRVTSSRLADMLHPGTRGAGCKVDAFPVRHQADLKIQDRMPSEGYHHRNRES